jgi:surface antigen
MKRPNDETLMAFADGMLNAEEHARVAAYLESDAEARQVVEAFKLSGEAAAQAFSDVGDAKSQDLIDLIMSGAPAAGSASEDEEDTVVPFRKTVGPQQLVSKYALPLAAGIALVIGSVVGFSVGNRTPGTDVTTAEIAIGPVRSDGPVAHLLQSKPSGESIPFQPREGILRELVVVSTFRDQHGRPCREFETTKASEPFRPIDIGVACREPAGHWTVEGAVHLAGPAVEKPSNGFEPASGVDETTAIEGLMKMLGAQKAFSPEEEKQALERDWKPSN